MYRYPNININGYSDLISILERETPLRNEHVYSYVGRRASVMRACITSHLVLNLAQARMTTNE